MPSSNAEWKETFEILEKYEKSTMGLSHAEHDEVWLDVTVEDLSPKDAKRLEELGWSDYGNGLQAFV